MRQLRRMNVHHASLFPDLIGSSEYCNLVIAEERREYELEQSTLRYQESNISKEGLSTPEEPRMFISDEKDVPAIAAILDSHVDKQVEPGRIQLIAEKINKDVKLLQVVDWYKRETILAKMRSVLRIILRKLGYPVHSRDKAIARILDTLILDAKEQESDN